MLNVAAAEAGSYSEHDVQEAVKHYYQRFAESVRQQTREHYRTGRLALALGIGVFMTCMIGRQLLSNTLTGGMPSVLDEGLIVLAWIALWLPTEHFVYDIAPLIRERRFFERLAQLRVHIRVNKPLDVTASNAEQRSS